MSVKVEEKDNNLGAPPAKKAFISPSEIKELSRDEIVSRVSNMDKYIVSLEEKCDSIANTDVDEKLKLQQQESTRRENVLVMRLATKEQEMQELLAQIHELKQSQNPSTNQLKTTLLDPSVNLLFEKMKSELGDTKEKLEQAQNDLSAWKFTSDSVTGKKLMAKCRMLIAENQDLGKQLSQGRIAQLEAELALQKKYNEELKSSQDELNEFVLQLDEEVEGMQSTICALQQQLKETKQKYQNSQEEINQIKSSQANQTIVPSYPSRDSDTDVKGRNTNHFETIEYQDEAMDNQLAEERREHDDTNVRTVNESIDDMKTLQTPPVTKESTKNPFSISNLLSPELDKPRSDVQWMDTDEAMDGKGSRRYNNRDEGTNGGIDSDSNVSS